MSERIDSKMALQNITQITRCDDFFNIPYNRQFITTDSSVESNYHHESLRVMYQNCFLRS